MLCDTAGINQREESGNKLVWFVGQLACREKCGNNSGVVLEQLGL